jgi:rare lipoprotein A
VRPRTQRTSLSRRLRFGPRAVGVAVIIAATGFATRPAAEHGESPDQAPAAQEAGTAGTNAAPPSAQWASPAGTPPSATRGAEASGILAAPVREDAPDWAMARAALDARGGMAGSDAPDVREVLEVLEGTASFYANSLAGRRTASGARYNPRELVAAHRHLPFGTVLRVTNPANDRSVEVRVIDRGPFTRGRVIDLSRRAAEEIGIIRRGHAPVRIEVLSYGS